MSVKNEARLRRARRARSRMRTQGVVRLSVHRTPNHIYAQVVAPAGDKVLASASTLDADLRKGKTGNIEAPAAVGKLVAQRAKEAGIEKVAFDRKSTWVSVFYDTNCRLITKTGSDLECTVNVIDIVKACFTFYLLKVVAEVFVKLV